jgi:hypothetical protein
MFRWIVGSSLEFSFLTPGASAALLVFGARRLRKMPIEKMPIDVFPEFAALWFALRCADRPGLSNVYCFWPKPFGVGLPLLAYFFAARLALFCSRTGNATRFEGQEPSREGCAGHISLEPFPLSEKPRRRDTAGLLTQKFLRTNRSRSIVLVGLDR